MTPRARHLNGVGLSLLTHAALIGAVVWLWQQQPVKPTPEPIRWEISLYTPAPPAPAPVAAAPPQEPTPPKPMPPKPQPKPKPKPKPKPRALAPPKPVTHYEAAETPPAEAPPPAPAPTTVATTGPLTGLASPAPAAAPEPKPDFDWLRGYLAGQIRRHTRYPGEARRQGWEGQVLIRAVIGGRGDLLEAEIVKSSGHAVLDDEALATLRRVMPVPVAKASGWSQVAVTIPFDYRLKR